jgi:CDP-diglyceride synthetase
VIHIPNKLPGLRPAALLTGLYAGIWISLEGALWSVILLGAAVATILLGYAFQKRLGGRQLSWRRVSLILAVSGLFLGLGSGALALMFMGIKTGLHAHGPEFTPEELAWMLRQIPVWGGSGLIGGLGVGLVLASERKPG